MSMAALPLILLSLSACLGTVVVTALEYPHTVRRLRMLSCHVVHCAAAGAVVVSDLAIATRLTVRYVVLSTRLRRLGGR